MSPQQPTPPSSAPTPVAEQARAWIAWLASGAADDPVRMQAFEYWLAEPGHRRAFEYERQLWRSMGPRPPVAAPVEVHAPRRRRRLRVGVAAAAVLALAWSAPEAWLQLRSDHRTGTATETVALPDGSRAVLDADSAIAIRFDGRRRQVDLLRGRAWFEVAPDPQRRFLVNAQGGVVEDISTAFVVDSGPAAVEATVEQGRVRVAAHEDGGWTYLQAGQRATYAPGGRVERGPDMALDRIAPWRQGELLLDAVDVRDAVARIGRYRTGPTFVRGDVSRLPAVSAAFHIDRPEQALDALAGTAGLRVTRLPLGVAIVRPAAAPTPD
ncbi:FecR family protein [Stenotrophomonas sp. GZD-301]|uniref:FecR family protein n=1 Tax=Stenotrophomonas sp. GZD-301 TaxID=3404814 RepID=UPI003BB5607B